MTPKEKSIDLYNKYFRSIPFADEVKEEEKVIAKRCALIAVDEIINNCTLSLDWCKKQGYIGVRDELKTDYWQEVKQEIESL